MDNDDAPHSSLPVAAPVPSTGLVLDLGRQHRKHINRLKRAHGRLTQQIRAAVDDARQQLGIDPAAQVIPVVILYRRSEGDYTVSLPRA